MNAVRRSRRMLPGAVFPDARRSILRLLFLGWAIGGPASVGTAMAEDGGVYIADQSFSIEQAFGQALAESGGRTDARFWVIVSGADAGRMTKSGAGAQVAEWVQRVRERGGIVYVCRSDLMRHGINEDELLDGVEQAYGYSAKDWAGLMSARKDMALPESIQQSQLILRTCSGGAPSQ